MKLAYRQEVQVLIWNQGPTIGRTPVPGAAPGHAALELRAHGNPTRPFISWWPGGDNAQYSRHYDRQQAKRAELGITARTAFDGIHSVQHAQALHSFAPSQHPMAPRGGQKPLKKTPYTADGEWGQSANEKIRLPLVGTTSMAAGAPAAPFGLDGKSMRTWFQNLINPGNNPRYRFVSRTENCAGTVGAALIAGGAAAYAKAPAGLVMTPYMVRGWATTMLAAMEKLNTRYREVVELINQPPIDLITRNALQAPLAGGDLIGAPAWGIQAGQPSSAADRRVDAALVAYHAAGAWGAAAAERIAAAAELMKALYQRAVKEGGEVNDRYRSTLRLTHELGQVLTDRGAPPF